MGVSSAGIRASAFASAMPARSGAEVPEETQARSGACRVVRYKTEEHEAGTATSTPADCVLDLLGVEEFVDLPPSPAAGAR
jgi:hypothetical protein